MQALFRLALLTGVSARPAVKLCTKHNCLFFCEADDEFLGALRTFQDDPAAPVRGRVALDGECHHLVARWLVAQAASFAGWTFYIIIFAIVWFIDLLNHEHRAHLFLQKTKKAGRKRIE